MAIEKPMIVHVAEFLRFIADVRRLSASTVGSYQVALSDFATFCRQQRLRLVREIDKRVIYGFLELHTARGNKPVTAVHRLAVLRSFWKYLQHEGMAQDNPPALVYAPRFTRAEPTWHPVEEIDAIFDALRADPTLLAQRDFAIIAVDVLTGLRCAETCLLRLEDVNLGTGFLTVQRGKGGAGRHAPLVPEAVDVLRRYLTETRPQLMNRPVGRLVRRLGGRYAIRIRSSQKTDRYIDLDTTDAAEAHARFVVRAVPRDSGWLFVRATPQNSHRLTGVDRPLTPRSLHSIVKTRIAKILGRPSRPHTLRHSFCSTLVWNDAPAEVIRQLMGHASLATTARYMHLPRWKAQQQIIKYLRRSAPPQEEPR